VRVLIFRELDRYDCGFVCVCARVCLCVFYACVGVL